MAGVTQHLLPNLYGSISPRLMALATVPFLSPSTLSALLGGILRSNSSMTSSCPMHHLQSVPSHPSAQADAPPVRRAVVPRKE